MQPCNLSNPKPGHTTGGSGRSARRSGRARSGKIACQQNYSPTKQKFTDPSKASKKRRFNVFPEARTCEIQCKPTEGQNQRLTRGLSPGYHRFITGLSAGREALFLTGCRPVDRRLFVSVNPFMQGMSGNQRLTKKVQTVDLHLISSEALGLEALFQPGC